MESKRSVLIADSSANFCEKLSHLLEDYPEINVLGSVNNGEETIHLVNDLHPDVLVIDLLLPPKNGIEVLKQITEAEHKPIIIAVSKTIDKHNAADAAHYGARYLMLKPVDMQALVERIQESISAIDQQETPSNIDWTIIKSIRDMGIPAHIKGYFYLIDAIKIAAADKLAVFNITRKIYEPIAEMYNTTAEKVSRAISRATVIGWDRADLDTLESYFGDHVFNTMGCPSNAECIAVLAESVRLNGAQEKGTSITQGSNETIVNSVTKALEDLGVPKHIKGYLYLHEALCRCVEDADLVNALNKVLYPVVAKAFETTPHRVERAIYHAIDMTWDVGDLDCIQRNFGYTVSNTSGKPTIAEFLALISDNIRRNIKM